MSVVTVNVGGQTVPVQVQTYQFGDLSISASAAAAITTINGLVVSAQTAETNAETAETNAETAEANAEAAAAVAEAARDQTAIYAGTTNISNFYANTTAGLAATASGAYFGVITTSSDGVLVYLDNAGSAVLQQTMPSINYVVKNKTTILLEYVSGTALSPTFRPAVSNTVLTGTGYQYVFEVVKWPFDKPVGSQNAVITQYDGTPWFTLTNMRDKDGTSQIGEGEILADDNVRWVRDPDTTVFRLLAGPDKITLKVAKTQTGISPTGQVPSIARPVSVRKVGANMWFVDVQPHDDHYENGITDRRQSDMVRFVLYDMGSFQGDTYAPALNSVLVRRKGEWIEIANHTFDDLISGIITNNGHVPSTFETVLMSGDANDTGNTTNYQLSGIGHGHLRYVAWSLIGTTNDASTSNLPVESDDLKALPINTTWYGVKLVSTFVCWDESPSGEDLAKRTMTMTFESLATGLCNIAVDVDPTDGDAEAPLGVREGGYACMLPVRDTTRARGLEVTPSTGAVVTEGSIVNVNLQDDSTIPLVGDWNSVEEWDHERAGARVRIVNNAGPGYTHWYGSKVDGNRVARTDDWFVINNPWGNKAYDPIYSDATTKLDVSAEVLHFDFAYMVMFGDDPEA